MADLTLGVQVLQITAFGAGIGVRNGLDFPYTVRSYARGEELAEWLFSSFPFWVADLALGVQILQMTALGACGRIDDAVDECWLA